MKNKKIWQGQLSGRRVRNRIGAPYFSGSRIAIKESLSLPSTLVLPDTAILPLPARETPRSVTDSFGSPTVLSAMTFPELSKATSHPL